MKTGTNEELNSKPKVRERIVVVFNADKCGELLDMLVGAGALIDVVGFVSPWQVAAINRIMQKDSTYLN